MKNNIITLLLAITVIVSSTSCAVRVGGRRHHVGATIHTSLPSKEYNQAAILPTGKLNKSGAKVSIP